MNTKIFVVRKKWLIVVLTVVLLFFGYITYVRSMKNYSTWTFYCAGRRVSAQSLANSNTTVFSITVNKKPVYMEIDRNNDENIDFVVHLENGVEKYTTSKKGNLNVREVIYHSANGDQYALFDDEETGLFTRRVWTSSKGEMIKEILVEGCWIPIKSVNAGQTTISTNRP